MKVFAVSDIHTDYPENLEWIKSLTKEEFGDDALIVAGDVSDDERTFVETFAHLSGVFRHVFFVAGNHELYLRRGTREGETREGAAAEQEEAPASSGSRPGDGGGDVPSSSGSSGNSVPLSSLPRPLRKFRDSVEKLAAINADLAALGVRTTPTLLDGAEVVFSSSPSGQQGTEGGGSGGGGGGVASGKGGGGDSGEKRKEEHNKRKQKKRTSTPLWIVPILSWYHASFDTEPRIPSFNADPRRIYTDFKACRWPPGLDPLALDDGGDALAEFFDSLNDPQLSSLTRSLQQQQKQQQEQEREQEQGPSSGPSSSSNPPRPVVISFSHFLPFLDLLPEKRFITAPNLASVAGSAALGRRVAELEPDVHVFGHTHIPFDGRLPSFSSSAAAAAAGGDGEGDGGGGAEKEEGGGKGPTATASPPPLLPPPGTRFVQAPLRYPAERRRSREGRGSPTNSSPRSSYELQLIWDCGGGTESEGEGEDEDEEEEEEREEKTEASASSSASAAAPPKVVIRRGLPGPTRKAFWTEYYEEHARDPSNLELAPWVRPRVERYKNL